jgi:hypothetical protein
MGLPCRVRQDKNFLNNPSLVVRVNERYTSFAMAAPILMSVLMFKVGSSLL